MTTQLLTLFTRTPLHVGAGSSVGAVDQPVIRERHTRFPVIPGSSLKGVLADLFMDVGDVEKIPRKGKDGDVTGYDYIRIKGGDAWVLFGDNSNKNGQATSGSLLVGEAKLLAFPVRSAKGCFAWLTCPTALRRFDRETGEKLRLRPETLPDADLDAFVVDPLTLEDKQERTANGKKFKAVFEEYIVSVKGKPDQHIVDALKKLSDDPLWKKELENKLAIVSDTLFQYFCENACEIAQHNRIDDETHVVDDGALFNQENVPSEAMFYSVLRSKTAGDVRKLSDKLDSVGKVVQIGADVTTGLGWCSVTLEEVK